MKEFSMAKSGSERPLMDQRRPVAEHHINALLSKLEPDNLSSEEDSWQQRKSAEMRVVIMDAAIDCLAQHGYARTTTHLIAKTAHVSRGAMLHHYPTKRSLLASVIDFAFFRHIEAFIQAIRELSDTQRVERNAGIIVDWQSRFSREYKAYLELNTAARTDEELRDVFLPRAKLHDQLWREELPHIFPEWHDDKARLDMASKFVRAALDGMVLNREIWGEESESTLLNVLTQTIFLIRSGALGFHEKAST